MVKYEEAIQLATEIKSLDKEEYEVIIKILDTFKLSNAAKKLGVDIDDLKELVKKKGDD